MIDINDGGTQLKNNGDQNKKVKSSRNQKADSQFQFLEQKQKNDKYFPIEEENESGSLLSRDITFQNQLESQQLQQLQLKSKIQKINLEKPQQASQGEPQELEQIANLQVQIKDVNIFDSLKKQDNVKQDGNIKILEGKDIFKDASIQQEESKEYQNNKTSDPAVDNEAITIKNGKQPQINKNTKRINKKNIPVMIDFDEQDAYLKKIQNQDGKDPHGQEGQNDEEQAKKNLKKGKVIGNYVLGRDLGKGTFGEVMVGTHSLTGEKVAIKVLEKEKIVDVHDVERVAREIHILKIVRHPTIIQLYEIIETDKELYLIMEYARGGELFEYIVSRKRVKEKDACKFLHQILDGVEYLHNLGICHRDLKPENLLMDDFNNIKIVDFGLSNTFNDKQSLTTACGSPCYAAPEMVAGQKYDGQAADMWSCGVIIYAMVCGFLPFEDPKTNKLYQKILNAEYQIPEFVSESCQDLIRKILCTNPKDRLSIKKIREHPWYQQTKVREYKGIYVGKNPIPVDLEIVAKINDYENCDEKQAQKYIINNRHNSITTTYYLILKRHLRRGGKSIADIQHYKPEDFRPGGSLYRQTGTNFAVAQEFKISRQKNNMTESQNNQDLIRGSSKQKLACQIKLKKEMTANVNTASRQQQLDTDKTFINDSKIELQQNSFQKNNEIHNISQNLSLNQSQHQNNDQNSFTDYNQTSGSKQTNTRDKNLIKKSRIQLNEINNFEAASRMNQGNSSVLNQNIQIIANNSENYNQSIIKNNINMRKSIQEKSQSPSPRKYFQNTNQVVNLQKNNFIFQKQARGSAGPSNTTSIRQNSIQVQGQGGESEQRGLIPTSTRLSKDQDSTELADKSQIIFESVNKRNQKFIVEPQNHIKNGKMIEERKLKSRERYGGSQPPVPSSFLNSTQIVHKGIVNTSGNSIDNMMHHQNQNYDQMINQNKRPQQIPGITRLFRQSRQESLQSNINTEQMKMIHGQWLASSLISERDQLNWLQGKLKTSNQVVQMRNSIRQNQKQQQQMLQSANNINNYYQEIQSNLHSPIKYNQKFQDAEIIAKSLNQNINNGQKKDQKPTVYNNNLIRNEGFYKQPMKSNQISIQHQNISRQSKNYPKGQIMAQKNFEEINNQTQQLFNYFRDQQQNIQQLNRQKNILNNTSQPPLNQFNQSFQQFSNRQSIQNQGLIRISNHEGSMDATARGTFFPGVSNQQNMQITQNMRRPNQQTRGVGAQVQMQKKANQIKQNARYNSTDMQSQNQYEEFQMPIPPRKPQINSNIQSFKQSFGQYGY